MKISDYSVDPCEGFDCGSSARCKLHPYTSEPFCEPSCELDNGGCPANQECLLKEVQCESCPCPPVVECTHTGPCNACRAEQTCILETIPCLVEPCLEVPRCLEPRCTLPSDPGPCRGFFPRFFYNVDTKRCEGFTYGGCLGNDNNFEAIEECEATCEEGETDSRLELWCAATQQLFITLLPGHFREWVWFQLAAQHAVIPMLSLQHLCHHVRQ